MSATSGTKHTNRLANATSPYLLQHQHNPVDWREWGPEALAEAKANNKPSVSRNPRRPAGVMRSARVAGWRSSQPRSMQQRKISAPTNPAM